MDKDSLMYGMDVLDEISGALEPIGLTVRKLDAEETQGLPVGLIVPTGEEPAFSCLLYTSPTWNRPSACISCKASSRSWKTPSPSWKG